jgi:hypothetical protein
MKINNKLYVDGGNSNTINEMALKLWSRLSF